MSTIEEFRKYLNGFKSEKGGIATHTSIDKGRYNIPNEELPEFYRMIRKALANGVVLHLTEKPLDPGPMRVDIDFRFALPTIADRIRIYTKEHVDRIVSAYFAELHEYLDAPIGGFRAYIMEKTGPVEHRQKLKDGFHIVFPDLIVTGDFQHLIRKKILDNAVAIFDGIGTTNAPDDIVDQAIIDRNNWQMYGSSKPGSEAYKVTRVVGWDDNTKALIEMDAPTSQEDHLDLVPTLSMRQVGKSAVPYRVEKAQEVQEFIDKVLPSMVKQKKDKIHERVFGKIRKAGVKNTASEDDFELAKILVKECLNPQRAENYDDWINLGWCLRNIDERLLTSWTEFSKNSSKYIENECQKLWYRMRTDGLSMGTLRMWARQDNLQRYNEILDKNVNALVDKSAGTQGAHYDVASVIHAMYKDRYRFITKDVWYVYDDDRHRWVRTNEALRLRMILSNEVVAKFLARAQYWNTMAISADDSTTRDTYDKKATQMLDIAKKLKTNGYKNGVMAECKCLFTDDKFEEKLDSHKHLLGFENGVYDLSLHIFRDGQPDDYVSYSTGVHYIPYNPKCQEAREIEHFLAQVHVNPSVRNYVKTILAISLDGNIKTEKFFIWTGKGGNGKSKVVELFQQAIGDYACILPISLLTQKRVQSNSAQSELERTKGRRFAVLQEPGEQEKLNIGILKELSGGDKLMVRGLFKEPIEFRPQFKMVLCCNDLPVVDGDDDGTWRRIEVTKWESKFTTNPDPNNPLHFKADLKLNEKFEAWAETFISMLIEHHKSVDPNNIKVPDEVKRETNSYKANNDTIGQFIEETMTPDESCRDRLVLLSLYRDFKEWFTKGVSRAKALPDRNQFRTYMEGRFGTYNSKGWRGIRYRPPFATDVAEDSDSDDE